jgi:hypothetical protein
MFLPALHFKKKITCLCFLILVKVDQAEPFSHYIRRQSSYREQNTSIGVIYLGWPKYMGHSVALLNMNLATT